MAYNPNNPNGQTSSVNSAPVVIASDQSNIPVDFRNGIVDIFQKLNVGAPQNQIDCQFFRDVPDSLILISASGGGTAAGGTAGYAQFSTSTGTTGNVVGTSIDYITYSSGGEAYSIFTAAFLDGGVATSVQYIGLFDDSNGFYVGYNATTFYVGVRNGGVDTQVAQASWNSDTLLGGSTSKFTRQGVIEAIDFTKSNIFRIRFSWLGAAPVLFEVFSPDGQWVVMHKIYQPNLSALPHIQNPDLPMRIQLTKTAGATNIRVNTMGWGAGINISGETGFDSGSLGTALNTSVTWYVTGVNTVRFLSQTNTTGTVAFETSLDGKIWYQIPTIIDRNLGAGDLLVTGPVTPTSGNYYHIGVAGYRNLRARVASTLGTTMSYSLVLDSSVTQTSIISNVSAPHNTGFPFTHKDVSFTTAQNGATVWAPATGKRFAVSNLTVSTGGVNSGTVTLWEAPNIGLIAPNFTYSTTQSAIFRGEFAPSTTSKPGVVKPYTVPYLSSGTASILRLTTVGALTVYVQVDGYES